MAAEVADPLNKIRLSDQPRELKSGLSPNFDDARRAMKTTPDTYSGVAVVAIAPVDKVLSSRDPSFIPANTPKNNALGTITRNTQNIKTPVADRRFAITSATGSLNTQLCPQ